MYIIYYITDVSKAVVISVLTIVKEIYSQSITSVINVREFTVEAFNMKNYFPKNIVCR